MAACDGDCLRPYRPDVSPISPASPIAIPPANFLVEAPPPPSTLEMLRAMPPQSFVPPAPFYSPVTDAEAEQQMEASGGAAVGSFLHYDQRDLVNGTCFVDVCLSVCRHAGRECVDKRDFLFFLLLSN